MGRPSPTEKHGGGLPAGEEEEIVYPGPCERRGEMVVLSCEAFIYGFQSGVGSFVEKPSHFVVIRTGKGLKYSFASC